MNVVFALLSVFLFSQSFAKESQSLWSMCDSCAQPESALYDPIQKVIYLSNVSGQADAKDGKGSVQKISSTGKMLKATWLTGLNAPKGLALHKGTLYVADIDEVILVSIKTGKIIKKIKAPGAKMLNDISVHQGSGDVYVSDTLGSKLFVIQKNQDAQLWMEGAELEGPNGLFVGGDKIYVAAWGLAKADWSTEVPGNLFSIDLKTKVKTLITKTPLGNLDGLEKRNQNEWLVSDWKAGKVYSVSSDGSVVVLLEGFKGAADIGFNAKEKIVYVPRMGDDQITAYKLD